MDRKEEAIAGNRDLSLTSGTWKCTREVTVLLCKMGELKPKEEARI